jgi:hypothetical protein
LARAGQEVHDDRIRRRAGQHTDTGDRGQDAAEQQHGLADLTGARKTEGFDQADDDRHHRGSARDHRRDLESQRNDT